MGYDCAGGAGRDARDPRCRPHAAGISNGDGAWSCFKLSFSIDFSAPVSRKGSAWHPHPVRSYLDKVSDYDTIKDVA